MAAAKKNNSKRKKHSKKKSRNNSAQKTKLIFSSLFLVAFVGSCLYGLLHLQRTYPEPLMPSYQEAPMEEPQITENYSASFEDVYVLLENELLTSAHSQGWRRLPGDEVKRLEMFGGYPRQMQLMELATQIAVSNSPAQLDLAPRKGYVRLYWDGQLRVELQYEVEAEVKEKKPLIAIIMDDMGRSLKDVDKILSLKIPVTPAILPQAEYADRFADILKGAAHEYMIHIPMQPKSYPAISPGPNALLMELSDRELRRRVKSYLKRVPGAAGGNNHMGSSFTQNRAGMRVVLEELRKNDLFFIDSKTIGGSVAFDEARKMGMRAGARHIFLDNEENVAYIRRQLKKMVKIAEDKGVAIAICHPYKETFQALQQEEAWLRDQPVDFVVASRLAVKH